MAVKFDLDAITIASPCTVPWDSMSGGDAKRFCGQCKLHVHDFSQMTRKEIQTLLQETNGNVCKRIWRRPDGRMITKDCGKVLAAAKRRVRALASAFGGLLAVFGFGGCEDCHWFCCNRGGTPKAAAAKPPAPVAVPAQKPPVKDAEVWTGK